MTSTTTGGDDATAPPLAARLLLPLLFFVSGASSLVLETVWTRQMVLVFGSTTFAVSTVLTAFMAGLAGGSFIAARRLARWSPRQSILLYGLLEAAIGLYSLFLPILVGQLPAVHRWLWGVGSSSYHTFALLRFVLAFVLLALPALAMGATLPVLTHALAAARSARTGRLVGTLYAINTAGAVVGVLLAGFVLLPRVGLLTTNWIACLADLALAGFAVLLYRKAGATLPSAPAIAAPPQGSLPPAPLLARIALFSMVVSGALSMAYEVAWTRALALVIGSSTYAFSLILLCFLLGLAGGAALYARRQAESPDQLGNLGTIHLLVAGAALATTTLIDRLPALLLVALKVFELSPNVAFLLKFALAALVIFLPALFMGMVFPAVVQLWAAPARAASRTAGEVYAINTVGSIIGSFAGGFVLVPWLGLQRTLLALVVLGCALAALFGALAASRRGGIIRVVAALTIVVVALWGTARWDLQVLSSGVFRVSRYEQVAIARVASGPPRLRDPAAEAVLAQRVLSARKTLPLLASVDTLLEPTEGMRLVRHREGITTTVGIGRTVDHALSSEGCWVRTALLVNGKPDASLSVLHPRPSGGCASLSRGPIPGPGIRFSPSGDAETQMLSGLLPLLLRSSRAKRGLVIGWGSGVSVGAALQGGVRHVVAVELEREVVAAARAFEPYNRIPQRDPRVTLVNEDGRNYLAATKERFDVVISEPSNPWMAGCGNLFTREFFRQVRSHLDSDGVFLQWLQAYEIAPHNVWSILATLRSVFESVHVFSPVRTPTDLLLVARRRKTKPSWRAIDVALERASTREALRPLGILGPADVLARLRAGPRAVARVSRGAPANTDDNARIEFAAPRDLINYKRYSSRAILKALGRRLVIEDEITDAPASAPEALCLAALRAGQLAQGQRRARAGKLARCGRVAKILAVDATAVKLRPWLEAIPAPPGDGTRQRREVLALVARLQGSREQRAAQLASLAHRGGRDPWLDAALGFLLAKTERLFDALALTMAARRVVPAGGLSRALGGLEVHLLRRLRSPLAAMQIAMALASADRLRDLSTAKTVQPGASSAPASRASTAAPSR